MHILEELARAGRLLCPDTGGPVRLEGGRVHSATGRDLGGVAGALNFLRARDTLDPADVPDKDVESIRAHLQLPPSDEVKRDIARAIAATGARFDQAHLSAEARMLAERFRIPALAVEPRDAGTSVMGRMGNALARAIGRPPPSPRFTHIADTVGPCFTAGREVIRNVRIRNGEVAAAMEGVAVRTAWMDAAGGAVAGCEVDNTLPVTLEPGREVTLMLRWRAPAAPGRYTCSACLVGDGEPQQPFFQATVDAIGCELPGFDYAYHPHLLEYGPDHKVAAEEVMAFLQERGIERGTLLEIGGGVHPTGHAIAAAGHRVVSSDISHSQSILGALWFRHAMPNLSETLAFVSCDGSNLPVADGTFDAVVLFAAFHHFADPRALLAEMRRAIADDGFIFIGCDNCVPNPADPEYREELRRGINEQMWTLPEYALMFREAGLRVARARVDFHSLKVCLVKEARRQV